MHEAEILIYLGTIRLMRFLTWCPTFATSCVNEKLPLLISHFKKKNHGVQQKVMHKYCEFCTTYAHTYALFALCFISLASRSII
jgi:hypothetical protein